MSHFLLRPRWLVRHLFALLVIATCVSLSLWQLQRLAQRKADNALLISRTRLPAVELARLDNRPASEAAYRRITVRGRYDRGEEVLLQTRSLKNRPGNHLLTPLVTASGKAVIVDRGWVPIAINQPGAAEARPPDGEVSLTGILLPDEQAGALNISDPPPGTVTAISRVDLGRLGKQLPYPVYPSYLRLTGQAPANSGPLPEPAPLPPPSEGPHRDYALQWAFFALTALVVYVSLLRKQLKIAREQQEQPLEAPEQDSVPAIP